MLGSDVGAPKTPGEADGDVLIDGRAEVDAPIVDAGVEPAVGLGPLDVEQAAATTRLTPHRGQDARRGIARPACPRLDHAPIMV